MKNVSTQDIYHAIDRIRDEINSIKKEPEFSRHVAERLSRGKTALNDDQEVLRLMATLIAYSQNAQSDRVSTIVDSGILEGIFEGFKIEKAAVIDADDLKTRYWAQIKPLRFPSKLRSIVGCARALLVLQKRHGSFLELLKKSDIPMYLKNARAVDDFWIGFFKLRDELKRTDMPFFKNTTSLLHFLLDTGYDCVKPDIIIMKVAKKVGIVDYEKGNRNFIQAVKAIQLYGVERGIKPSIIDFYFLIYGGQKWALQFIKPEFRTIRLAKK